MWKTTDERTPFWWMKAISELPNIKEPLMRQVFQVNALRDAITGDFELINRVEFARLFSEVTLKIGIQKELVLAEPVFSPNKRIVGIRLYPAQFDYVYDDDDNYCLPIDFDPGTWATFDLDGCLLANCGLMEKFDLNAEG